MFRVYCRYITLGLMLLCMNTIALSQSSGGTSTNTPKLQPSCNDAKIWGQSTITDICWSCILPVTLLGFKQGGEPPGSNSLPACSCPDKLGVPQPGFTMAAWLPYRVFETVRNPFCMPVMGGEFMNKDWLSLAGPSGKYADNYDGQPLGSCWGLYRYGYHDDVRVRSIFLR